MPLVKGYTMDSILKKLLMKKVKKEISNVTYDELDKVYGIYENLINLNIFLNNF